MLLDTHAALWLLSAPSRLGVNARAAVTGNPPSMVSAVSHSELLIKAMLGKLLTPDNFSARLLDHGLQPLPFTERHAAAMADFPQLADHDPFDRMLLAQARSERLSFLTADRRLLALGLDWVVDAQL